MQNWRNNQFKQFAKPSSTERKLDTHPIGLAPNYGYAVGGKYANIIFSE